MAHRYAKLLFLLLIAGCSEASGFRGVLGARRFVSNATPSVLQSRAEYVAATGGGFNQYVLSFNSNLTAASWIVVAASPSVVFELPSGISDTQGNTFTSRASFLDGTYGAVQVWTAPASAGADTVTVTTSTTFNNTYVYIVEVAHVSNFDTHTEGKLSAGGFTTSLDWPSFTPNHNDILLSVDTGGMSTEGSTLQPGWTAQIVTTSSPPTQCPAPNGCPARLIMWNNIASGVATTPHIDLSSASYGSGATIGLY